MGTSKSYIGPRGKSGLLPAWAVSGSAPASDEQTTNTINDVGTVATQQEPTVSSIQSTLASNETNTWSSARRSLSQAINSGGSRQGISKASSAYVKALGGRRRAAASSTAGLKSTASLGSFLSGVASEGLSETLRSRGLGNLVGQSSEIIFAAICDLIAPPGGPPQENLARESITEALEQLYDTMVLSSNDPTKLDALTAVEIRQAIETAISAYIYKRWLFELGIKIEQHAISADRAVKLERDMKSYIYDTVQLDFANINILEIDWQQGSSLELVENLFQEAYGVLEGQ